MAVADLGVVIFPRPAVSKEASAIPYCGVFCSSDSLKGKPTALSTLSIYRGLVSCPLSGLICQEYPDRKIRRFTWPPGLPERPISTNALYRSPHSAEIGDRRLTGISFVEVLRPSPDDRGHRVCRATRLQHVLRKQTTLPTISRSLTGTSSVA